MSKEYILAIDAGTTSSRTIIFDLKGNIISVAQEEFRQIYPEKGWVEHDAEEIAQTQLRTIKRAVEKANIESSSIIAIGITNQRETVVAWDKNTGKPLYNAIVWQCRRTTPICEKMKNEGMEKKIREKTGLVIDPYFSATKMKWLLENVNAVKRANQEKRLAFGTIDSWLLAVLTGWKSHKTDHSNASRTMLYNINTLDWDDELLRYFGISRESLPEICDSNSEFGVLDKIVLNEQIPITGILGDQQAALFGQSCFDFGEGKITYGTGSFILVNIGEKPVVSKHNLLTTVAWVIDGKPFYAIEGSVFIAGAAIQWLRDNLKVIENSAETEVLALEAGDSKGLIFVPAFTGLGAPYWKPEAKGLIYGITRDTEKKHIVRACLEGIAFSIRDVLDGITNDCGKPLHIVKVDGGASANNFLIQFQSDLLGIPIVRPKVIETTAMGAALMAGFKRGGFDSLKDMEKFYHEDRRFTPSSQKDFAIKGYDNWKKVIEKLL